MYQLILIASIITMVGFAPESTLPNPDRKPLPTVGANSPNV